MTNVSRPAPFPPDCKLTRAILEASLPIAPGDKIEAGVPGRIRPGVPGFRFQFIMNGGRSLDTGPQELGSGLAFKHSVAFYRDTLQADLIKET